MNFRVEYVCRKADVVWVAKRPSEREVLKKQDEGLFRKSTLCCVKLLKASAKAIYSAKLIRISKLWHIETLTLRTYLPFRRPQWNPTATETKRKISFDAKRGLPSFPRDRWRNCRLISSISIGSEYCPEFVIFSQPRVMIIHDWVTTIIVVHGRFTTNGYALPVPHIHNHKMDL